MTSLSLDFINSNSPYKVYWHNQSRTYRFKTDYGVVLAIGFDEDDMLENAESYVLSIINVDNISSPRDSKMRETVLFNSSLKIQYSAKQPCAASTRDL